MSDPSHVDVAKYLAYSLTAQMHHHEWFLDIPLLQVCANHGAQSLKKHRVRRQGLQNLLRFQKPLFQGSSGDALQTINDA